MVRYEAAEAGKEPKMADIVKVIAKFADENYEDFKFLNPDGTLSIDLDDQPTITKLRLELPSQEPLHLVSVIPEGPDMADLMEHAKLTMSSAWKRYGDVLQKRILFDPNNRETAFHTKREARPWLEIEFKNPTRVDRVRLRNRPNGTSIRARGIQLLCQKTGGAWTTYYDGIMREREFLHDAEKLDGLSGGVSGVDASAGELLKVLALIELRDYADAVKYFDLLPLAESEAKAFRAKTNAEILSPRRLEWQIHGIRRSFRFWSKAEQAEYVRFSNGVIDALRKVTDNTCFGFGSVLSIVRDKALMPHDDDLDVLIAFEPSRAPTLATGIKLIREVLEEAGYVVAHTNHMAHQWVTRAGYSHKIDVFVGIFEGESISWYPGARRALSRDMMFPAREMELLGQPCLVPREPESYLERVYGSGWRVPDPEFRHAWDSSQYADIAR